MPTKKTQKQETFEEKLTALEEIVNKMEGGEMPLSDMLKAYETGMKLSSQLNADLSGAEKRMQELVDGQIKPMEDAP